MRKPTGKQIREMQRLLPRLEERRKVCSPAMAEDLEALISMCKHHLGRDDGARNNLHQSKGVGKSGYGKEELSKKIDLR